MIVRRLLALTVALSAALPLTAVAVPSASAAATNPGGRVTNVNRASQILASYTRIARTPGGARYMVIRDTTRFIPALKGSVRVSKVRNRRFTLTYFGDQACLTYTRPTSANGTTHTRITAGTCTANQRHPRQSLMASATRIGTYATRLMSSATRTYYTGALNRLVANKTLRQYAQASATAGVRISGVSDKNNDGLDDDGRVTFRRGDHAVCAELPITPGAKAHYYRSDCRDLPARDTTAGYRPIQLLWSTERIGSKAIDLYAVIGAFIYNDGAAADQLSPAQVAEVMAAAYPMTATHPTSRTWIITDPKTGCTGRMGWPQDQVRNGSWAPKPDITCPQ